MPVEVAVAAWADRNNNYMTAADTILPQCVDLRLLRVLTAKATLLFSIKSQCISIDCVRLKSCLFPVGKMKWILKTIVPSVGSKGEEGSVASDTKCCAAS